MKRSLLAVLCFAGTAGVANADPSDVAGMWLTESQDAIVEIADCGDSTPCGTIVWFDETNAEANTDIRNPDPALQSRPIVGMEMLSGFQRRGERWRRGTIYNAENGKTYGSGINIRDNGDLTVKGCIGPICQTQVWTPVAADDPRLPANAAS
ncbi:MAG: DUF2147 domain-containing protein [Pseudomonadota bacterium]